MKSKWVINDPKEISKELLDTAEGSKIIAQLLINRGITTKEKALSYLNPDKYIESSPYEIPDLNNAKDRIIKAIKNKEKITVFGDYDVDGVTSTACLLYTLKEYTDKVDFYIPSRLKEGYGLNIDAVEKIHKKHKAKLLITCDCGVTNHKEIEHANSLGIDVIVTDHHSLPDPLPNALAVLNPKMLPEDHKLHFLPGVGVAYKLAEALLDDMRHKTTDNGQQTANSRQQATVLNPKSSILKKEDLLDLVTLGMIADLAPLVDENRYLVQIGLPKLAATKKIGLQELLRICGHNKQQTTDKGQRTTNNGQQTGGKEKDKINAEHVGFGIAPRINAVGRLTDANKAVKLLTTNDLIEAVHLATELDVQNKQRQVLCEQTLEEALEMIKAQSSIPHSQSSCIVLANENWHHGVIGIVASRIVERFGLPTILIAIDKEQNIARGSGRSSGGFNIIEALNNSSKHLEKHGGHKAACGLSLKPENIENFITTFKSETNKLIKDEDIGPTLKIDLELPTSSLSFKLLALINKLAPFGFGNRTPVFASNEQEIVNIRTIGKNNQHLKLHVKETTDNRQQTTSQSSTLNPQSSILNPQSSILNPQSPIPNPQSSKVHEALIWNYDEEGLLDTGDKIKVAYSPKINIFNGETRIQLQVKGSMLIDKRQQTTDSRKLIDEMKILDYREKTMDCVGLLAPSSHHPITPSNTIFFAEVKQKDFLPLKTFSRNKIKKCGTLVLLECPPDENTLSNIINKSTATEIYLAFSHTNFPQPQEILKNLTGMLKYAQKYKDAKVNKEDLSAALGLSNSAISYAIETLARAGLVEVKRDIEELTINIMTSSRQSYTELVEYSLFVSELKKTNTFTDWLQSASTEEIARKLKESITVSSTPNLIRA